MRDINMQTATEKRNTPFIERCEYICKKLNSNLISKENRDKLLQSASLIHRSIDINHFGFESCLTDSEANLDLNIAVCTSDLDEFHKSNINEEFILGCKNKPLIDFLNKPLTKKFTKKKIPSIWIAFDLRSTHVWPPQPNLYLSLGSRQEEHIEIMEAVCHELKLEKTFTKIAHLIPNFISNEISLFQLGFMLARSSKTLRVCSKSRGVLATSSYITYLNNIGLHGLDNSLGSLLDRLRPYLSHVEFTLDIKDQNQETFGMGFSISEKTNPAKATELWSCILSILHSEGLVHKKKQNTILEWCGQQSEPETCPFYSAHGYYPYFLKWDIYHMKIIFSAQQPLQAKAYLGCRFQPALWVPEYEV